MGRALAVPALLATVGPQRAAEERQRILDVAADSILELEGLPSPSVSEAPRTARDRNGPMPEASTLRSPFRRRVAAVLRLASDLH